MPTSSSLTIPLCREHRLNQPEEGQAQGAKHAGSASSLRHQIDAIRSPDGGPPCWPGNAELSRNLESTMCGNDKGLSIGSGFGFTFDPDSPTPPAVGEGTVRINTTADSPAARGTSDDNAINIDYQRGHGGATPSTPTPGIRRFLSGVQHGVQTDTLLPSMGGPPPSTCFSPSIFDGGFGGIEPTTLDDVGDNCDLSLGSELIMFAQEAFSEGVKDHDDRSDYNKIVIDATQVQLLTLLEEVQRTLTIKMVEMINDTIAHTKTKYNESLEKLVNILHDLDAKYQMLLLEKERLARQLKAAEAQAAAPESPGLTPASSVTSTPLGLDLATPTARGSSHPPCTPVSIIPSFGLGSTSRNSNTGGLAAPFDMGPTFSPGTRASAGIVTAAAATVNEPREKPAAVSTSAAESNASTAAGVRIDGAALKYSGAVANLDTSTNDGDASPVIPVGFFDQDAVSTASSNLSTSSAVPTTIDIVSPPAATTAAAAAAATTPAEPIGRPAPNTPAAAGVPTEGAVFTPAPSAVADLTANPTENRRSHGHSTPSSTPATPAAAPIILDLVSPTGPNSTAAPSSPNPSTPPMAPPSTATRAPPDSCIGYPLRNTRGPVAPSKMVARRASTTTAAAVPTAAFPNPVGKVASLSIPSSLRTTPSPYRPTAKISRTPSSSSSPGNQRPPMRFAGAGGAISSPPRALPERDVRRRASLDTGGTATKPLGSSPVQTASVATARRASITAAATGRKSRLPLLDKIAGASLVEVSSTPAAPLWRSPLAPVTVNDTGIAPQAGLADSSPFGAEHLKPGVAASASASARSRASGDRRAAGSTPSSFGRRVDKENSGNGTAARPSIRPHVRGIKTIAKLGEVRGAKEAAASAASARKTAQSARNAAKSARDARTSKREVLKEKKVAGTEATGRRPARIIASSRRATGAAGETQRRSARIAGTGRPGRGNESLSRVHTRTTNTTS